MPPSEQEASRRGSMLYFALRVAVGSAIMIAFYVTRGFESNLETFVIAFAAALASQTVAFGVKLLAGDERRTNRSIALLAASAIAVAVSVAFVAAR